MDDVTQTVPPQEMADAPSPKIKVICRLQDGAYTEQMLVDNHPAVPSAECDAARTLLHTFAPESMTRQLASMCGKDAVVVFRTSFRQMNEFRTLLSEHDSGDA
ncbi:MAG: hypothetical protein K2I93_08510 [Oscillospiraceae bacterium]|nr:hypothetical protein [Oscillospiraceae bacterium]